MLDQASFSKLNTIFSNYLIVAALLKELKSARAICLYQELIKLSLYEDQTTLLVSYKSLKNKVNYGYESIKLALNELEKFKLLKRGNRLSDHRFYIELNHDYWIKQLKGII
jgi:hypothetical protein